MTRKALILTTGMAGLALLSANSHAQTKTWTGTAGTSWANANNWNPVGVPGAANDVVIPVPSGLGSQPTFDETTNVTIQSLDVRDQRVLSFADDKVLTVTGLVNVESGGTINLNGDDAKLIVSGVDMLDIDANGIVRLNGTGVPELELTADSSTNGHPIDGLLELSVSGALLDIQDSVKFIGNGEIRGAHNSAQIVIASSEVLTNAMSAASGDGFRGFMRIVGSSNSGTFTNNGLVYAQGGTIELASSLGTVNGSGTWEVASTGTRRILFSKGGTTFTGNFVIAGEMEFGQNVTTTGQLTFNTGAFIDVGTAGTTFTYSTFNGSSNCGNPGTGGGPYVVNADKTCP